ncbi:hypothetical protein GCM10010441_25100 [Kitasatospora paracochleata]|uniref:Uncharacterized protein n=1 Tax=Kitasatospora paracochleata TaxID=58354 RepID=A0ABT1J0Z2_9ACTN|nr:hypothetical protein [Kitasatospora paracochleata]MCP2311067.1 hypothetical protein [Kitasatospora paracochleata]
MSDERWNSAISNFQTGANDGDIIAVAMKTAAVRPNSKGPAPVQDTPEAKWVTVHAGLKAAKVTGLEFTSPAEVNPEDVATLSLRYDNGQPLIVVSSGKYIPAKLEDPHDSRTLALEIVDLRDPEFSPEETYRRFEGVGGNDLEQTGELERIPADQVNPAEVARLALTYRYNLPAIVAGVGQYVPTWLPVVDGAGNLVAAYKTVVTESALIPADQVNPEDIGALSLRYVDNQPHLVVSAGTYVPAELAVDNTSGTPVATARLIAAGVVVSGAASGLLADYMKVGSAEQDDFTFNLYMDTAGRSTGPAQIEPEATGLGEIPSTVVTPEIADATLLPADQVKPEDIGTLSIEYRDGQPVIVVSGGTAIPAGLTVVDGSSTRVTKYQMGPPALFEIPRDDSPRQR